MKKLFTLFLITTSFVALAQVPQKISYQAIARQASGAVLPNQSIGVEFIIYQNSPTGTVVYKENHNTSTNSFGLFSLFIGGGTPVFGNFSSINWSTGIYFIETLIDPIGGTSYTSVGTQQLMSVPYALYAETSGNASSTPTITINSPNMVSSPSTGVYNISVPSYSAGTGISISSGIISNTGSTSSSTITGSGIAVVSPSVGSNFTVSVPPPTYSANGPTTISGSYPNFTVNSPTAIAAITPTITGAGIAVVSPTVGNNFTVSVPAQTVSISSGSLAISLGNSVALPTNSLSISSNSLTLNGLGGNTILLPSTPSTTLTQGANVILNGSAPSYTVSAVTPTLTGAGSAIVTGLYPNQTVNVAPQVLGITANTITLSGGGGSVTLSPQPLSLTGTTLTSGPATNSVNLALLPSVWTKSLTNIYPTTPGDKVGIGTTTPNALLDIQNTPSSTVVSGPILNIVNTNTTYTASPGMVNIQNQVANGTALYVSASAGSALTATTTGGNPAVIALGGSGSAILAKTSSSTTAAIEGFNSGAGPAFYGGKAAGQSGGVARFENLEVMNGASALSVSTNGTGAAISAITSGTGAAIVASNNSTSTTVASHGVYGLTNSTNTLSAGVYGNNTSIGPSIYASKTATQTGTAGGFEIANTNNGADAVFAVTQGSGAAVHAVTSTSNPASALSLWLENGHIKSTQVNQPAINFPTAGGGVLSVSYTPTNCTDVNGSIGLIIYTSSGVISSGGYLTIQVNFSKPYTSGTVPVVVITPTSDYGMLTASSGFMSYYVSGVSNSQFSVTLKNNTDKTISGFSLPYSFNYFVIE